MTPRPPEPETEPAETDPPEVDAVEAAFHAVVDGEADAEQRRLVARAPDSAVRLEALRATREAVAAVPRAEPGTLDRMREAALASTTANDPWTVPDHGSPDSTEGDASTPDGDAGDDEAASPVVPLAPRAARRRWPALPAVAALVAVLFALGVVLLVTDGDGGDTAASRGDSMASDEAQAAPDAGADLDIEATFGSAEDLPSALESATDPGRLSDLRAAGGATAEAAPSATDGAATTTGPASGTEAPTGGTSKDAAPTDAMDTPEEVAAHPSAARCDRAVRAVEKDLEPAQAAAVVEVDGQAMIVLSHPITGADGAAGVRLTVLDATSCVPKFGVIR